jgi:acetolactate synthase regulatory subunit
VWLVEVLRSEVEKLRDVALVRACSVRRGVAIQPKVLEKGGELGSHDA